MPCKTSSKAGCQSHRLPAPDASIALDLIHRRMCGQIYNKPYIAVSNWNCCSDARRLKLRVPKTSFTNLYHSLGSPYICEAVLSKWLQLCALDTWIFLGSLRILQCDEFAVCINTSQTIMVPKSGTYFLREQTSFSSCCESIGQPRSFKCPT